KAGDQREVDRLRLGLAAAAVELAEVHVGDLAADDVVEAPATEDAPGGVLVVAAEAARATLLELALPQADTGVAPEPSLPRHRGSLRLHARSAERADREKRGRSRAHPT